MARRRAFMTANRDQRRIAVGERPHQFRVEVVGAIAHLRRHALFVQHARAGDLAAEPEREIAIAAARRRPPARDTA